VFAESKRDPANDPTVLWLTGGPGCSSLIAWLGENGPYRPDPSDPTKLIEDAYSWNDVANVIWLESPAGVGFGFSKNPNDYHKVTDTRTTNDTFTFLQTFFRDLFPQFQPNKFYITGESYGGHYVPLASQRIVEGNAANEGVKINIQGFMEGNAWSFMPLDNLGAINTWEQRAIVPADQVAAIKQHCNLSYVGPLRMRTAEDAACDAAVDEAMEAFIHVDIYDIYVDVCPQGGFGASKNVRQLRAMARVSWLHDAMYRGIMRRSHRLSRRTLGNPPPFDACEDAHLTTYLNQLDVQKALNAVPASADTPIKWNECSETVQYDYDSVAASVLPTLEKLFDNPDFHPLVYSGDVDAIVPFDGTMRWINSLNRTVKDPWHVWLDQRGQAGGFATVYDGFTFTTVRNAGHQVPEYQDERAYTMFTSWLHNHTVTSAPQSK